VPATAKGAAPSRPRVVILRGHQANLWELRPWEHPALATRFDVTLCRSRRGWFDVGTLGLKTRRVRTARDLLPPGRLGDLAVRVVGDRHLRLRPALEGADLVHSQELGNWYSMQAARLKPRLGFKLVLTAWETIPFLDAYRNVRTRPYRRLVLERTDLFLATTERARACLLLEGAPAHKVKVCPPGVDATRFSGGSDATTGEHLILSAGRLAWHKGHQDVLRAVAALRYGLAPLPQHASPRVLIVGAGPEEARLRAYAAELGIADAVEIRGAGVPYDEMGRLYDSASCLVLASLPEPHWEEQFGMVLVEAMFAGLAILTSNSGAIPEVTRGSAVHFPPGDWLGLAHALADGPLARAPRQRTAYPAELIERYTGAACAERLAGAYDELLGR
jgi:glycosyltransferase involved in cell wall biosynthesis